MARKASLATKLKRLQKKWNDAEPKTGRSYLPDGNYNCRIESATIEESAKSGTLQISWNLSVVDGDYEGKSIRKWDGLEGENSLDWLQGSLETLELELPDNIEDLGATLEESNGLLIEVSLNTRDEFQNCYFNELLEQEEGEDDDEEEEEGEDEEEEEDEEDEEDEEEDDEEEDEDEEEEEEEDDEEEEEEEPAPKRKKAAKKKAAKKKGRRR